MIEENAKFCEWIKSLKRIERSYFIYMISSECEVKKITVYKWTKGDASIRKAYKYVINKVSGLNLFSLN